MSDYIKIGDVGVIARNQITAATRSGDQIHFLCTGLATADFKFSSAEAAQKVLADVLRQLCRDSDSDYRFFKSPDGYWAYYAVPASGEQTGRSFFPSSDGGTRPGDSLWSLAEMFQEPADEEVTQQQFETAVGSDWRSKL